MGDSSNKRHLAPPPVIPAFSKKVRIHMSPTPKQELDAFIAKYFPEIASLAVKSLKKLRARLPGAWQLVYDNYNALVIGFSPTERTSDAIFSIALYPSWVSFFFLQGAGLPDPAGLLQGTGNKVRRIVLSAAEDLDQPEVEALIARALEAARTPMPLTRRGERLIVKSVSERQRPRVPAKKGPNNPASRSRRTRES